MPRVLLADDDSIALRALARALSAAGHQVEGAEDGEAAVALFRASKFDAVVTDLEMPRLDGYGVLAAVRATAPQVPVIVVTARNTVADCARAMRAGAADFLTKPFHPAELVAAVAAAIPGRAPPSERASPPRESHTLIGESAQLREMLDLVERVAPTDATVLIRGETGTGKELVARLLHGLSPRASFPLVAVNCGALAESVVESELFGHVRGAFTGAAERRLGKFQKAHQGTIFLDEIGELSPAAQVKLLRVLQEREIVPVGGDAPVAIDVRVVAATHRDLAAMVAAGAFRADLYYRLDVIVVNLPSLRRRPSDIPLLVEHFLDKFGARHRRPMRMTSGAIAQLASRAWPGNVRELENFIERIVLTYAGAEVREADLPPEPPTGSPSAPAAADPPFVPANAPSEPEDAVPRGKSLPDALADLELRMIEDALKASGGNQKKAAGLLGIHRTTLIEKLRRLRREAQGA